MPSQAMSRNSSNKKPQKKKQSSPKGHNKFGDVKVPKALQTQYKEYHFKRTVDGASLIFQQAGVTTLGGFNFQLAGVDNYTEFTSLFDAYKIDYIEITLRPQFNMVALSTSATVVPTLYTAIDLDDSGTPAALADIRQYQTLRESRFDHTVTRTFKPRVASALYSGAFTSYSSITPWIDCASPSVQYYGLKYGVTAGAIGQTNLQSWSIEVAYYFSFKFAR